MLSGLSLLALAIPVAIVALGAIGSAPDQSVPSTEEVEVAEAADTATPPVADDANEPAEVASDEPQVIGFESCTIVNGLIPADPDTDGTVDLCWAVEGAGDRPAECPGQGSYTFVDADVDGIIDTCRLSDLDCAVGQPIDADGDGRADLCLTLDLGIDSP